MFVKIVSQLPKCNGQTLIISLSRKPTRPIIIKANDNGLKISGTKKKEEEFRFEFHFVFFEE